MVPPTFLALYLRCCASAAPSRAAGCRLCQRTTARGTGSESASGPAAMSVRRVAARCLELGSARRAFSSATGPLHRKNKDTQAADMLRELERLPLQAAADSQYQLSGVYEWPPRSGGVGGEGAALDARRS